MSEKRDSASSRLYAVDTLRLIGIALVLGSHVQLAGIFLKLRPPAGFAGDIWQQFRDGRYGAFYMFFATSGYLITRHTVRRSPDLRNIRPGSFYVARAARILPALFLFVVVGAVGWGLLRPSDARSVCFQRPWAVLDFQFWVAIPTFMVNWLRIQRGTSFGLQWDILWSLAVEEQYYLVYPWFLRLLGTRERVLWGLGTVIVGGCLFQLRLVRHPSPHDFAVWTNSCVGLGVIAMGSFAFFVTERWRPNGWLAQAMGWGSLAAMTVLMIAGPRLVDVAWLPLLFGATCSIGLVALGHEGRWRQMRIVSAPGKYIYGAYLSHVAILFCLWPILEGWPLIRAWALLTVLTLSFAWVLFLLVERPASRWIVRSAIARGAIPRADAGVAGTVSTCDAPCP